MEKIRNGRWREDVATPAEFEAAVSEMKSIAEEHGFWERAVYPYSWKTTVKEMIASWEDYAAFTLSSREIMIQEANGLIDLLNYWVKEENRKKGEI